MLCISTLMIVNNKVEFSPIVCRSLVTLFHHLLWKGNFHHLVAGGIHILARKNDVILLRSLQQGKFKISRYSSM